jgi:hypothetical protein
MVDTLVLSYTLPTTRACSGLAPVRLRPCWAHKLKALLHVKNSKAFIFIHFTSIVYQKECTLQTVKSIYLLANIYINLISTQSNVLLLMHV